MFPLPPHTSFGAVMLRVLCIPGFGASDLVDLSGDIRWFDTSIAPLLGIGCMRLDPNGQAPQPPDGLPLQISGAPQAPWGAIVPLLRLQLDPATWSVQSASYDWRYDLLTTAQNLAATVRLNATPATPFTLVGHSAGGLVAVLTWSILNVSGQSNLLRRVITICSPFQGSYAPQQWLEGTDPSVAQLRAIATIPALPTQALAQWSLAFLNALALTWPSFYQLMPALGGTDAILDPNRSLLFDAGNYAVGTPVSQNWLDRAKNLWQPGFRDPATYPPDWCLTAVVSTGLTTAYALASSGTPLDLAALRSDQDGDSIVTSASQTPPKGQIVTCSGSHASVPFGITVSGLLASLIKDPRGPISPPAPPLQIPGAIPQNVTAPPESSEVTGLLCLSGG